MARRCNGTNRSRLLQPAESPGGTARYERESPLSFDSRGEVSRLSLGVRATKGMRMLRNWIIVRTHNGDDYRSPLRATETEANDYVNALRSFNTQDAYTLRPKSAKA